MFEDGILCLNDGKKVVFMKRHLRSIGVGEEDYRRRWGLPDDYPMVSPGYAADKRRLALQSGLGRRGGVGRGRGCGAANGSGRGDGRIGGTLSPSYG